MHRLAVVLLALFPLSLGAQEKKNDLFQPLPAIKVVSYNATTAVDFEKQIYPIVENKCLTCHSGSIKKGRYDMSTLEGLIKGGKTGIAIEPAKPDQSLLVKLAGRTGVPPMPPKDDEPLTPEELALIKAWIAQGAKGTLGVAPKAPSVVKLAKLPERLQTVFALAISPDKKVLAAGRGATISLFSPEKGEITRVLIDGTLKDEKGNALGQSQLDVVGGLAFSKDGSQLFSAGYREVTAWNVATGAVVKRYTDFADRVVALDVSPDGRWLAAAGGAPTQDGEVKVLDTASGQPVHVFKSPHSDTVFGVRFSPDGLMLATCGADKFVKVWAMKPILRQEGPSTAVGAVASLLTPGSTPGFGIANQVQSFSRWQKTDWSISQPGQLLKSFEGHTHHVLDVAWRADGKLLVSAGADNVLKVWDFDRGEQARTIGGHAKQVSKLAMFATSSSVISACGDAGLRQWNIDNGGNLRNFSGATDFLHAVACTPDGTLVASGGEEGIIRLYNGQNGTLLKTLPNTTQKK